jgi:AsmA family protein
MRGTLWLKILFPLVVIVLLLVIFWNWDWFIPFVDARASASLGRQVTIQHLHVGLGRTTTVTATGISIANPSGFPKDEPQLASIDRLLVDVDVLDYIEHRTVSLTRIEVDHPVANIRQLPDGTGNYTLNATNSSGGKPPKLGELIINNGTATVIMPRLKTNLSLTIQTRPAPPNAKLFTGGEIVADAHGTYANAPITGQFIGGALLSLRDPSVPYPVDLHIQNGTTLASLTGTIEDPGNFAGARLRLSLSGQSLADLYQLTGVPIPETPPFKLTGDLHYAKNTFRFENFAGRVGSSDLEGTITEAPGSPRRLVTANLSSHRVDLTDLAGFLGGTPGKTTTPGQTAATREKVEAANARGNLLPTTKFNLPAINGTNVDLRYRGEHIINRDVPLDNLVAHVTIINGRVTADPLNFAVGTGAIISNFDLNPVNGVLHVKGNIDFRRLQLSRLMAATHTFAGDGTVGGSAYITGTGNSLAEILGGGNGHATLFMQHGADISALMVDLAGLQMGDAILSALGVPVKTNVECMVSDFSLANGLVDTRTFLLATKAANILGSGTVNLATEKVDLSLRTQATHFSIGSLSTPINIGGTLKNPSVMPAAGPLAARAAPAAVLGILFPPLALLPTIRLGLGDKNACADAITALNQGNPHNPE